MDNHLTETQMNIAVRTFLETLPGPVFAGDSAGAILAAWDLFGNKGDLEMFRKALRREAMTPEPLGDRFCIRLPSRPTPDPGAARGRRLRNVLG